MSNQTVPDCLACAVRQLTEGRPEAVWNPQQQGDSVSGVVLRISKEPTRFDTVAMVVDLWHGGTSRTRVMAYSKILRDSLVLQDPKVGDRLTVTFDGYGRMEQGRYAGQRFRMFTVEVERGHH